MRSRAFSRLSIPVAVLAGLCVAGPASGADPSTPLSSVSKRVYPSGANINQKYTKPAAAAAAVMDAAATVGHVSSAAAMSNLMSHPSMRDRLQKQLTPILRSQTRIQLGSNTGQPAAAAAEAAAPPPSLYKFSYGFHYKDVPLWKFSSQSQLIQARGASRKVLFTRERNVPDTDQLGATEATVQTDDATKVGLDDAKDATDARLAVDDQNETPHREIHVDANGKPTLAHAFVVRSTDRARPFARRYWVAARDDPKILSKEDLIYHAGAEDATALRGQVTGNIIGLGKSPLDPPARNQGLIDCRVTLSGGITALTDANGFFNLSAGITALNAPLSGPFCRIINDSGSLLTPTKTGNNFAYNARTEEELAQVSAFEWVSFAHAFVADFLPSDAVRLNGLPTHVNIDQTCNAFFDPNDHTLNFFKSGDGCANSAYCDVASHEFGHAVDDQFGDILDGGYSEGFGDSLAILITRDSIIGRDFQGRGNHLRNARDIVTWPPRDDEVHEVGRIYGGFTWELTQRLVSKHGSESQGFEVARQLVLGAAALNPKDTPDAVRLSFFVDRQNGSPNFNELVAAAQSRRIPHPESPEEVDDPRFLAAGDAR